MTAVQIRYVHAGDISTVDAHKLVWNVGDRAHRYQELAIVGEVIIGSWTYDIEWRRKRVLITSQRTDVLSRYQGRGVARTLWLLAILRWKPTSIEATISTDQGRDFLARMTASIALHAPNTRLWAKPREADENFEEHVSHWAQVLLRKVGEEQRTAELKQLAAKNAKQPPQLKAVNP